MSLIIKGNYTLDMCNYQLKSGSLTDIPFLTKIAAFFQHNNAYCFWPAISANADNTVRQASSTKDHATERN
ncbi:hypothetical protein PIROE2DRAFT_5395 [Piromyces sp. E2]|nr:hypothetical protein PIROE2DRAFT_5395 [Piromyces sp. E2]|eukprot:OUM67233.1 hypothetical protein PIROE2DRAFT_5395 [Piromyces sp. E2]